MARVVGTDERVYIFNARTGDIHDVQIVFKVTNGATFQVKTYRSLGSHIVLDMELMGLGASD